MIESATDADANTEMAPYGVLILAGGEATRLPGKLELPAGDVPLVVRVFRNFSEHAAGARPEIVVSAKASFVARIDASLEAPLVIDRWSRRGPLAGMLTAFARMHSRYVFVVSGDAPNVMRAFADRLFAELRTDDEAVVPMRSSADGTSIAEPLCALYDRLAFVRVAMPILRSGRGAVTLAIECLNARRISVTDDEMFTNINTPADYDDFRAVRS